MECYIKHINGENILTDFENTEVIERVLKNTNGKLFFYCRDKETNEITEIEEYSELNYLPNIEDVIQGMGYQTHTFNDCLELYEENFENSDQYLPFDNDEIYITEDDVYQGCCTKNGFEFSTKTKHFFFGIKNFES